MKTLLSVAFTVLLATSIGTSAWATGEGPLPCVDLQKVCQDAASPGDPITFTASVTNCGEVMLYCLVQDLITHEALINGPVPPGETVEASGAYSPDECGESTNRVRAQCAYPISPGVTGRVYDEDKATCSVPCEGEGCTLTPGYWKTHSKYGPAPYDPTWAAVGEDTLFFISGLSWYEAMWTEPSGGNAYFILAPAYIAAQLNFLAGASVPSEVLSAVGSATVLLSAYTPDAIGAMKGNDDVRKAFIGLAETLDDYNNGLSGPGHCDDEADGGDACK